MAIPMVYLRISSEDDDAADDERVEAGFDNVARTTPAETRATEA